MKRLRSSSKRKDPSSDSQAEKLRTAERTSRVSRRRQLVTDLIETEDERRRKVRDSAREERKSPSTLFTPLASLPHTPEAASVAVDTDSSELISASALAAAASAATAVNESTQANSTADAVSAAAVANQGTESNSTADAASAVAVDHRSSPSKSTAEAASPAAVANEGTESNSVSEAAFAGVVAACQSPQSNSAATFTEVPPSTIVTHQLSIIPPQLSQTIPTVADSLVTTPKASSDVTTATKATAPLKAGTGRIPLADNLVCSKNRVDQRHCMVSVDELVAHGAVYTRGMYSQSLPHVNSYFSHNLTL